MMAISSICSKSLLKPCCLYNGGEQVLRGRGALLAPPFPSRHDPKGWNRASRFFVPHPLPSGAEQAVRTWLIGWSRFVASCALAEVPRVVQRAPPAAPLSGVAGGRRCACIVAGARRSAVVGRCRRRGRPRRRWWRWRWRWRWRGRPRRRWCIVAGARRSAVGGRRCPRLRSCTHRNAQQRRAPLRVTLAAQ